MAEIYYDAYLCSNVISCIGNIFPFLSKKKKITGENVFIMQHTAIARLTFSTCQYQLCKRAESSVKVATALPHTKA